MEIKLTQNKFAIVDDADYALVSQHKWYAAKWKKTYVAARKVLRAGGRQETIYMHRVIMGLKRGNKMQVDHINHDELDNRRVNLRSCTHQQNSFNRVKSKNKSSHYKGVSKQKGRYWRVQIKFRKNTIYLGCYKNEQDAARAYNVAALKYFGEFAKLNII